MKKIAIILLFLVPLAAYPQFSDRSRANLWDASWITIPGTGEKDTGLYLFRKTLSLVSSPDSFRIFVSGDNRFKLYVNDKLVSVGPTPGDLSHWNYEIIDLAPYLTQGNNVVAAEVWNEGDLKPVAQFSLMTGFILQGTNETTKALNTNDSWKCSKDESYTPIRQTVRGYYAAGAG
ncbi:MAG: alpha-rhamnosidase, partial [Bacteroidales bacterium]|nr:alpha-rhamnosidase [Bacteroidales bacterium]